MSEQAKHDAEDAAKWRLMLELMDSDAIRVVMRGVGSGAGGRDAGMIASDADEIVDHMVTTLWAEYPEGLPSQYRLLVNTVDKS